MLIITLRLLLLCTCALNIHVQSTCAKLCLPLQKQSNPSERQQGEGAEQSNHMSARMRINLSADISNETVRSQRTSDQTPDENSSI